MAVTFNSFIILVITFNSFVINMVLVFIFCAGVGGSSLVAESLWGPLVLSRGVAILGLVICPMALLRFG